MASTLKTFKSVKNLQNIFKMWDEQKKKMLFVAEFVHKDFQKSVKNVSW